MKTINIKNLEHLKEHIKKKIPSLYISSQTSTVIPYEKIQENLTQIQCLINLSTIPGNISLEDNNHVKVSGNINWAQLKEFLNNYNKMIKTSPTEELASVLAGIATSCTGERSFAYGNLRNQIKQIKYINHEGKEKILTSDKKIKYKEYQNTFKKYQAFKNAPFPRLEKETDLLIGTEGQLGIIYEALIEVSEKEDLSYLFLLLPHWKKDYSIHIDLLNKIQSFRNDILSCEFIDKRSWGLLKKEDRINKDSDVIFLEIKKRSFEKIYEEFISKININENNIFEISESKYYQYRKSIPRSVSEYVNRNNIKKKGTDIQTSIEDFNKLLELYKKESNLGIDTILFGHFGDCHLHFNYLPKDNQSTIVDKRLVDLYKEVSKLTASPFAEHGLGILKKPFIGNFWTKAQYDTFFKLKQAHDPHGIFFPEGFLNWKESSS